MGFEEYAITSYYFGVHKPVENFTSEQIHNFLIQKGIVKYAIAKTRGI